MNLEELKRFKLFAQSPYHNSNKTISRFVKYIDKYFDALGGKAEAKRFENRAIFKQVYPNIGFNEGTFSVLRSQTLSLLEDFFIVERLQSEKKMKQKFLAESYKERNTPRIYQNNYLKYEKINDEERQLNSDWIMHRLQILLTKMGWKDYDRLGEGLPLLIDVIEDLNVYFLHKKMMLETIKANYDWRLTANTDTRFYDVSFKEQLYEYKENNKVINLYVKLHELIYEGERELVSIEAFRKEFELVSSGLQYVDKEIIFYELQNFVIRKYNVKGTVIAPILFDIYMTGINSDLIANNGQISFTSFYNIAISGINAKKFEEVDLFIQEFGNKLSIKDRSAALLLIKAHIVSNKREKGCWDEIVDLLADFSHPVAVIKMKGRFLLLKAFFMIFREDSSFYYLVSRKIKGFKLFLFREKKVLKRGGEESKRFAFWLQKLTEALNSKKTKEDMRTIYDRIKADESISIFEREWFLELQKK